MRLAPPLDVLEEGISQQTGGAYNETPHDDFVLIAVPLEAHSHDVLFRGVFANVKALAKTESLRALRARRGCRAFR